MCKECGRARDDVEYIMEGCDGDKTCMWDTVLYESGKGIEKMRIIGEKGYE